MPTPFQRIKSAKAVSEAIVRDRLFAIYLSQYKRFAKDLKARLGAYGGDMTVDEAATVRAVRESLSRLKRQMTALGPKLVGPLGADMATALNKELVPWSSAVVKSAPSWIRDGGNMAIRMQRSVARQTLLEKKLLQGRYARQGLNSIHAQKWEQTAKVLRESIGGRLSFQEVSTKIELQIWDLDVYKGDIPTKKSLGWVKRLVRTEYSAAANDARYNIGKDDPDVIGYIILMSPTAAPSCQELYGGAPNEQAEILYSAPLQPKPPESHPNCNCELGDYVFRSL